MDIPVRTIPWPRMPRLVSLNTALVLLLAAASAINGAMVYAYL